MNIQIRQTVINLNILYK